MKKLILVLAAALSLTACKVETAGPDGYYFEQSERLTPERDVRVITYKSIADVQTAFDAQKNAPKLSENAKLQAFSVITNKTCTIHMVDPNAHYMPEFIGHELTHCLYGEFHPKQNEKR